MAFEPANGAISPMSAPPAGALGDVKEAIKNIGDNIGAVARDKAVAAADGPKLAGADMVEGLGRAVHKAADEIGQEVPLVAGYVHDAAANIDKVAEGLRTKSVGELLDMATSFGRQQPIVLFAGALVVGFALSRFVKSGIGEVAPPAETLPSRAQLAGIGE